MVQYGWRTYKPVMGEKYLKSISDVQGHIPNAVSPYQQRLLLTWQNWTQVFTPSRTLTIHTHASYCISPSCKHPILPSDTTQLTSPRPHFQQPAPFLHLNNSCKSRHQTLLTSCTAHERKCYLPPSNFTSRLLCHGWLWTWKCKCWHWLNFCIPAGFKWYVVAQVGLGAFAVNNFILRN